MFHEWIKSRGANLDMCIKTTREAGHNDVADELERICDHGEWVKYAIEHIKLVREFVEEQWTGYMFTRGLIESSSRLRL